MFASGGDLVVSLLESQEDPVNQLLKSRLVNTFRCLMSLLETDLDRSGIIV